MKSMMDNTGAFAEHFFKLNVHQHARAASDSRARLFLAGALFG